MLQGLSAVDKDMEFVLLLFEQFTAEEQLHACTQILPFLGQLTQLHAQGKLNI